MPFFGFLVVFFEKKNEKKKGIWRGAHVRTSPGHCGAVRLLPPRYLYWQPCQGFFLFFCFLFFFFFFSLDILVQTVLGTMPSFFFFFLVLFTLISCFDIPVQIFWIGNNAKIFFFFYFLGHPCLELKGMQYVCVLSCSHVLGKYFMCEINIFCLELKGMQYVCVLCSHVLGKILKTKYRWETNWSCSTHYICACPDCMNTKKKLYYTSVFLVKKNETNWSCSTHYICACPECMNTKKDFFVVKKAFFV